MLTLTELSSEPREKNFLSRRMIQKQSVDRLAVWISKNPGRPQKALDNARLSTDYTRESLLRTAASKAELRNGF